jgi:hypothetical protein
MWESNGRGLVYLCSGGEVECQVRSLGTLSWELVFPAWLSFHPARDRERDTGGDGLIRVLISSRCFAQTLEGGQTFLPKAMEAHTYMRASVPQLSRRSLPR